MTRAAAMWLECSGCGARVEPTERDPFACPRARPGDDVDHVLVRRLEPGGIAWPQPAPGNPYLAFRALLSYRECARAWGVGDDRLCAMVQQLDAAIAEIEGRGFTPTPLREQPALATALSRPLGSLWAKDETGNVSGSHKARHLMGVMIHLRLRELAGRADPSRRPRLAIASCGNAALAAAVVAAAARWPLDVFVPPDANPAVRARLDALGATVIPCPRDGGRGDPCMRAFVGALRRGALPFSVQGPVNGLAVEGGLTLGYELAEQLRRGPGRLDGLVVQVGGGALASACLHALRDAVAAGVLPALPRLYLVQTTGAAPLRRAYARVIATLGARLGQRPPDAPPERAAWARRCPPAVLESVLRHAAQHRSAYMWPWETAPRSVAYGILDDETYDWWALVDGMIRSGGFPVNADEATLVAAHAAVNRHSGASVCATGSAGVAGLMAMDEAAIGSDDVVAVLLTGRAR